MNLAEKIQFHRDQRVKFHRLAVAHELRERRLIAQSATEERRTWLAMRTRPTFAAAAEFLGLKYATLYKRARKFGFACLLLAFLISSFTASAQIKGAQLLLRQSTPVSQLSTLNPQLPQPLPAVPNLTNRGFTVTLAVTDFVGTLLLEASTNKTEWRLVASSTQRTNTISGIYLPQYFRAKSFLGEMESEPSNVVGWIANDEVVSVYDRRGATVNSMTNVALLWRGTNPPASQYFGTAIEKETVKRIEP